jgi:rubredoxin
MNRGAFGTPLVCQTLINGLIGGPQICGSTKWELINQISPFRIRYRCKVCHKTIIYEFTNNPGHPYEAYGKNKWQRIVDRWKQGHASRGHKS